MYKAKNILAFFIGIFLSITSTEDVFGIGFTNSCIGLKGMGMGNSLTGIADDASAVYFNPAGLAFGEKNSWSAELYLFYAPIFKHEYSANSITDESNKPVYIPSFFISKTYDSWAFGFGAYVPYAGGGTAYDDFQGTPYDLESFAAWYALTPTVAYKFSPNFSVGVGLSLYAGQMERKFFDPTLSVLVENEYDGTAGYGAHIGFLYKPTRELSIGFIARGEIPIEMDGEMKIAGTKFDSEVDFTLPSSFSLGFGYQPNSKIMIGLSFYYYLYGDTDKITIKAGVAEREEKTYYKNCWDVGLGIEYKINDELDIRAGLKFDQSATKDKGLNPATVDVDLITPSINVAYGMSESIEMNLAVLYAIGLEEKVNLEKYNKNFLGILVGLRFRY